MKAVQIITVMFTTVVTLLALTHCASFVVSSAPSKKPIIAETPLSKKAKEDFWKAFEADHYESLPQVLEQLTQAYIANPNDPEVTLLLGHAHLWKIAERSHLRTQQATITDELILSKTFFSEARQLNPEDSRILGWLGGVHMSLGSLHHDEKQVRQGYMILQKAKKQFPAFNHFSAAYVIGGLPPNHPRFHEAVEDMWKNLDACIGKKIDRKHPDYHSFLSLETHEGPKRVCWNGAKAPHNFEGFFLAMGDLLVKAGDPETAKIIYANAELSPTSSQWRYRSVLLDHMAQASTRTKMLQNPNASLWPEMMNQSKYACAACHAQ